MVAVADEMSIEYRSLFECCDCYYYCYYCCCYERGDLLSV